MLGILTFYLFFAWFCLPGYLLARASYPELRKTVFPVVAGFVFSQAVFALVAWPCLWIRCSAGTFWLILHPVWAIYVAASACASAVLGGGEASGPVGSWTEPRLAVGMAAERWNHAVVAVGLISYLGWAGMVSRFVSQEFSWQVHVSWEGLTTIATLIGLGLAWSAGFRIPFRRTYDAAYDGDPPWLWTATALTVIALQAVGAAIAARPDWDDAYYLNAVHQYLTGAPLNFEVPSLPGDGLPVPPHMRLLAWELWGATLCRFSGLNPVISHHTFLPPLIVVLAFAAHWSLFRQVLLPRRLVPLAILVLSVGWLFGNLGYNSQGNYLLNRAWQGKTVLWTVVLPVEAVVLWEYLKSPSLRTWLPCALTATGAVALSTSAVFLVMVLVPTFCLTMIVRGGLRVRLPTLVAAVASAGAVVVYGLFLHSQLATFPALSARLAGHGWRLGLYEGVRDHGATGIFWIACLPILATVLPSRPSRAYLVAMPIFLTLTVLNPFLYEPVAKNLTSYITYHRLYWLCSAPVGLAAGAAVNADYVVAARRADRGVQGLLMVFVLAIGLTWLPGHYVWGLNYHGPYPGLEHAWAENLSKFPDQLVPVLQRVSARRWSGGALLFSEDLSPYFVPYHESDVRFVVSRPSNTIEALSMAGRPDEGQERVSLAVDFLEFRGTSTTNITRPRYGNLMNDETVRHLLDKYRVLGVVNLRGRGGVGLRMQRLGFRLSVESGQYQFWERSEVPRTGR